MKLFNYNKIPFFDKRRFRFLLLSLFGFLLGMGFWGVMREIFSVIVYEAEGRILFWGLAALVLFCTSLAWLGIIGLSLDNKKNLALFMLFSQGGYLFFFGIKVSPLLSYCVLVLASLFWLLRARRDFNDRINLSFNRSLSFGLKACITLFLLVVSFSFYVSTRADLSTDEVLDKVEKVQIEAVEKLLSSQIQGYDSKLNFSEFIKKSASNGMIGKYIAGGLRKEDLHPVVIEKLRQGYSERLGVEIGENMSLERIIRKVVHNNLTLLLERYSQFFPFAVALVLFFILKILSIVYYLLIKLSVFLFYKLLRASGWLKVKNEEVIVRRLSYY